MSKHCWRDWSKHCWHDWCNLCWHDWCWHDWYTQYWQLVQRLLSTDSISVTFAADTMPLSCSLVVDRHETQSSLLFSLTVAGGAWQMLHHMFDIGAHWQVNGIGDVLSFSLFANSARTSKAMVWLMLLWTFRINGSFHLTMHYLRKSSNWIWSNHCSGSWLLLFIPCELLAVA